jgi:hypothetical protein
VPWTISLRERRADEEEECSDSEEALHGLGRYEGGIG